MLAIVFSLEKFDHFTYIRHVKVHSDHKPLESILKKPLATAPRCLQGMMTRLQKYSVDVRYDCGKDMHLADTLSRAFLPTTEHPSGAEWCLTRRCKPTSTKEYYTQWLATGAEKHSSRDRRVLQCQRRTGSKGWRDLPPTKNCYPTVVTTRHKDEAPCVASLRRILSQTCARNDILAWDLRRAEGNGSYM